MPANILDNDMDVPLQFNEYKIEHYYIILNKIYSSYPNEYVDEQSIANAARMWNHKWHIHEVLVACEFSYVGVSVL